MIFPKDEAWPATMVLKEWPVIVDVSSQTISTESEWTRYDDDEGYDNETYVRRSINVSVTVRRHADGRTLIEALRTSIADNAPVPNDEVEEDCILEKHEEKNVPDAIRTACVFVFMEGASELDSECARLQRRCLRLYERYRGTK